MSGTCCEHTPTASDFQQSQAYRRVLGIALALNVFMCAVEIVAGHRADSLALVADALDFFSDSANYAISLFVLPLGLAVRARAAILKGACMALFGLGVLAAAIWHSQSDARPMAEVMSGVGVLALAVNIGVALLLLRHRTGDANRRSVWLCSRNDAIGNVAVVGAAIAVGLTGSRWPDLAVAAGIAVLALVSSVSVLRQAFGELAEVRRAQPLAAE